MMTPMSKPSAPQPEPGTAGTAFEASISFLLVTLGNRLSVEAERVLRRTLDLSFMEWRVLTVLAVEPAAPPGRIVSVAGVNKAAVSRAVNSLERRGLLTRVAAPEHRLRTQLFLTDAGTELFERGTRSRLNGEDEILAGLTAEDRQRLLGDLRQLLRNLDAKSD
jgi:DNA-binding MarR family transcriptional regulator